VTLRCTWRSCPATHLIRVLLTAGADCQLSDRLGFSPLQLAVHNDRVSVLKLLLQAKADSNVGNGRVTPLHRAARQGNLGMVKLLLAAGADPTRVDQWGRTPAGLSVRKPFFLRRFLIRRVLKGSLGIFCGASCSKKQRGQDFVRSSDPLEGRWGFTWSCGRRERSPLFVVDCCNASDKLVDWCWSFLRVCRCDS
jgi:hypothetical protein